MNEKIELKAIYPTDKEKLNLLKSETYNRASSTIKKGSRPDIIMVLCALVAIACFALMTNSGMEHGFSTSMKVLLVLYAVIAIFCIFTPLHRKLSAWMWGSEFSERFPVNRGFGSEFKVSAEGLTYTDTDGAAVTKPWEEYKCFMAGDMLVIMQNDKNIWAAEVTKLEDEDLGRVLLYTGAEVGELGEDGDGFEEDGEEAGGFELNVEAGGGSDSEENDGAGETPAYEDYSEEGFYEDFSEDGIYEDYTEEPPAQDSPVDENYTEEDFVEENNTEENITEDFSEENEAETSEYDDDEIR